MGGMDLLHQNGKIFKGERFMKKRMWVKLREGCKKYGKTLVVQQLLSKMREGLICIAFKR